jgi:hypothetical protein
MGEGGSEHVQDGPLLTARHFIFASLVPHRDNMIRGMVVSQASATWLSMGFRFVLDMNLVSNHPWKTNQELNNKGPIDAQEILHGRNPRKS